MQRWRERETRVIWVYYLYVYEPVRALFSCLSYRLCYLCPCTCYVCICRQLCCSPMMTEQPAVLAGGFVLLWIIR